MQPIQDIRQCFSNLFCSVMQTIRDLSCREPDGKVMSCRKCYVINATGQRLAVISDYLFSAHTHRVFLIGPVHSLELPGPQPVPEPKLLSDITLHLPPFKSK